MSYSVGHGIDLESLNKPILHEYKKKKDPTSRFIYQFRAIIFRRYVLAKRSWKMLVLSTLASLFFTSLAILAHFLVKSLYKEKEIFIDFSVFGSGEHNIILVNASEDNSRINEYISNINGIYFNDTGEYPCFLYYADIETMDDEMYSNLTYKNGTQYVRMGFWFKNVSENSNSTADDEIAVIYNSTVPWGTSNRTQTFYTTTILNRIKWKMEFGTDLNVGFTELTKHVLDYVFSQLGPMLITGGLLSQIPIIASQPIIDTRGEVRQYMQSCSLVLAPYWLATFVLDFLLWTMTVTLIWVVFLLFKVQAFLDNKINTLFLLVFSGPGFILFMYCISFWYDTPDSVSRNSFIQISLLLLIPIIIDIVRDYEDYPIWLEWFFSFIPFMIFQRGLMKILSNLGFLSEPLSYYFVTKQHQAYWISMFTNIPLYGIILLIIEYARLRIQSGTIKRKYHDYVDFFDMHRKKHKGTSDAEDMERLVQIDNNFAVRIVKCSRLFFSTSGDPIPAVTSVSLGVRKNSIFGFLGANGAGKTTLIKMITSLLPPSSGTIEINGRNIETDNDPTLLSVCPQFNNHLCMEMTMREHFYLYTLLHQLDKSDAEERINRLVSTLDMGEYIDKPLRELSAGDCRKLAIALSFFGDAEIILLDEPTASLDPVARHQVHDMILSYKGEKTFMLCTHLLSEAEFLCDTISIMVKGCVYTCGTPQYLTEKFGSDYKIDLMVVPGREASVDKFFENNIPEAKLTITRKGARIYSVPTSFKPLYSLLDILQKGYDEDSGYSYFTCSSSSLERVFLEIVQMSENDDVTGEKTF